MSGEQSTAERDSYTDGDKIISLTYLPWPCRHLLTIIISYPNFLYPKDLQEIPSLLFKT